MKIDVEIRRDVEIVRTARVRQVEGLFDVPAAERAGVRWRHRFELPGEWNVGVVVGASGAGKSTFVREAFAGAMFREAGWEWPGERSILDGFPGGMGIREITGLLSSVGFSSPPSWLRPFGGLSTGEQFRVNLARTLAEAGAGDGVAGVAVVDEFSSVVDRTVARIGSAAVAKTVRRRRQKFVAVTCHYDVLDWLEPDWVYEPGVGRLTVRKNGGGVESHLEKGGGGLDQSTNSFCAGESVGAGDGSWRRPGIEVVVRRVHRDAWKLFKPHHYLDGRLHPSAICFVGWVREGRVMRPAVFTAVIYFPHATSPSWREHRTVCLPDFQGVGIGNAMSEFVASLFAADGAYTSTTSHPAMIRHRVRSRLWKLIRGPSMVREGHGGLRGRHHHQSSVGRITAGFRYVGKARVNEAKGFGLRVNGK